MWDMFSASSGNVKYFCYYIGRNLMYSRALEIVQNEEYLDAADLNVIRNDNDNLL